MVNDPDGTTGAQNEPTYDAQCRKCGVDIPADAKRCRECGYEGYEDTAAEGCVNLMMLGLFFSILIITAPVGVPMFALGLFLWTYCKIFRRGYWRPQA